MTSTIKFLTNHSHSATVHSARGQTKYSR